MWFFQPQSLLEGPNFPHHLIQLDKTGDFPHGISCHRIVVAIFNQVFTCHFLLGSIYTSFNDVKQYFFVNMGKKNKFLSFIFTGCTLHTLFMWLLFYCDWLCCTLSTNAEIDFVKICDKWDIYQFWLILLVPPQRTFNNHLFVLLPLLSLTKAMSRWMLKIIDVQQNIPLIYFPKIELLKSVLNL